MKKNEQRHVLAVRNRRKQRVRAKVSGTADRPRLSIFRSLKHISAQLIDDRTMKTVVSARDGEVTEKGTPTEIAHAVGTLLAKKAQDKNITAVIFDRSHYRYHGRVKAVADGARKGGLKF